MLLCVRVLAVRVSAANLQALWPIALAELKRILAQPDALPVRASSRSRAKWADGAQHSPHDALTAPVPCAPSLRARQPSLVLSAFLLLDTLLAVLPDEFGFHAWMFLVPSPPAEGNAPTAAPIDEDGPEDSAADEAPAGAPARAAGEITRRAANGEAATPAAYSSSRGDAASGEERGPAFEPYLARLAAMGEAAASAASRGAHPAASRLPYATSPSADGRRRPLLALAHISSVVELAPYAAALDAHVHRNDISARGTVVDSEFVDALLGAHFVSRSAAERRLAGLRDPSLLCDSANGIMRVDSVYAHHTFAEDNSSAAASAPLSVDHTLAEAWLIPICGPRP